MALTHVGLQKTTLLDFPGEVAATVFTPGCNLRCPYCHNPTLVQPPYPDNLLSLDELDRFLGKRAAVLGGVCITGGEPLLHDNLHELTSLIRSHGLKVKLDTNGTFPERLAEAEVDYIAMDLKTAPEQYDTLLSPTKNTGTKIEASVAYLKSAGIAYELRTTVVPGIVGPEELKSMLPLLQGAEKYVLTPFRPGNTLAADYTELKRPSDEYLQQFCNMVTEQGIPCTLGQ
ncbi:MAG: anaerobic ribonucleoside-triphosphate reductase activating protein [Spirochaetia bacterium]|nr:anaerobic ribonucleoside-triphosphate reductase activating protein [Spirochaetia bacterium]